MSANLTTSVRSNSLISNGLKFRPVNYPITPVVQGSGVLATEGRKFPIGKETGRNASEPGCSLVNLSGDADLVDRRGRSMYTGTDNGSGQYDLQG